MSLAAHAAKNEWKRLRAERKTRHFLAKPFGSIVNYWTAGETLEQAVHAAVESNRKGQKAHLQFLTAHPQDPQQIQQAVEENELLLRLLKSEKRKNPSFEAAVVLDLEQLGLQQSNQTAAEQKQIAFANLHRLLEKNHSYRIPIEISASQLNHSETAAHFFEAGLPAFHFDPGLFTLRLPAFRNTSNPLLKRIAEFGKKIGTKPHIRLVETPLGKPSAHFPALAQAIALQPQLHLSFATSDWKTVQYLNAFFQKNNLAFELEVPKGTGFRIRHQQKQIAFPLATFLPYGKDAVLHWQQNQSQLGHWIRNGITDFFRI